MITSIKRAGGRLLVRGLSHDNGTVASIKVNGVEARIETASAGVVDWVAELDATGHETVTASAIDQAGNREETPAKLAWRAPAPLVAVAP